ncbi:hypothetical protein QOZ80_5BG0441710 [Eleusine coracana subsp. coracana]|nr:hypothetical protein QOZ80_5BG0441710 [Eleusine coracana subsp. coracana]
MAQQAVFTVLQRSSSTAVDEATNLLDISEKVNYAKKLLLRMQPFVKDLDDKMMKGGSVHNLFYMVREVAYGMEDIIDTVNILIMQSNLRTSIRGVIFKYACFPVYLTHLHKLNERIASATARMKTVFEEFERCNIDTIFLQPEEQNVHEYDTAHQRRSIYPDSSEQVEVIGFDEHIKQIKDDLLDPWNKQLTVLSIIGPGGAGKTTIAKKVYSLVAVKKHFEAQAWITVSQIFEPRDLLKELVNCITELRQDAQIEKKAIHELKKLLHDFLLNKKYLIVLDDVWSTTVWDIIRPACPDMKNGSRILFATRNEVVAQQPNARKKLYQPKLLNIEESTKLLLSTALREYMLVGSSNSHANERPNFDKLEEMGKDIAKKCQGLPLAIVVLGGYLSRNLDVTMGKSSTIINTVLYNMITSGKVIGAALDLSFYDMPVHLRSCFMYTTAFPQDSCIDAGVLSRLWIAEGFIPLVRGYSHEEVAIKYIDELVQRCMIQVEKRAISGRVMMIKMHDIVHHWGMERARKERFIKNYCTLHVEVETACSEETMEFYHAALQGFLAQQVSIYNTKLRSLLAFHLSSVPEGKSFQGLHHLRVLYLHCLEKEVFLPREIGKMRYLRYLGFGGTCTYHLPSSVGNLLSLETIDATGGRIYHIPGSMWKIPGLQRVRIARAAGWSVPRISSQSKVQVTVLSSTDDLHSQRSSNRKILEAEQLMEATIQQLSNDKNPSHSYIFGMTYNTEEAGNHLKIVGRCMKRPQFNTDLPDFEMMDHITALTLQCANLLNTDQKMLEIGRMMFLKVLEIGERSYTGLVLTCPSGSFKCLVQLVLYDLALESWKMQT